jgi:hypothetical protein
MEDVGHDFVGRQEVYHVEGINDALFGLAERTGGENATQHEQFQVVRVGGY